MTSTPSKQSRQAEQKTFIEQQALLNVERETCDERMDKKAGGD
jgi:hypothetical protein